MIPKWFDTLREANVARQAEWDGEAKIGLTWRANEQAGEVGEALERAVDLILLAMAAGRASNLAKKIERQRLGIRGSRATVQDLADELADVAICADLIAMGEGIDLQAAISRKFNATSIKVGLNTRLTTLERPSNTAGEPAQFCADFNRHNAIASALCSKCGARWDESCRRPL
ncbi:hypothetical protein [Phenylobacterium sp.]|uniref:hypothetical protein n=1 Tax=Phenylobacterium sp. TaxID=1871053 RepID=UPI0027342194|nr:hypothetical protein [Phenylobacterium sp.]MDP3853637.1 hypothetical protein [Phenylobacterium sp.]